MVEFPTVSVKQREKTRVFTKNVATMWPLWPTNCCHDSLNLYQRKLMFKVKH